MTKLSGAMAAELRPGDPPASASTPTLSTRVGKSYASEAEGKPFAAAAFAGGSDAAAFTLPAVTPFLSLSLSRP